MSDDFGARLNAMLRGARGVELPAGTSEGEYMNAAIRAGFRGEPLPGELSDDPKVNAARAAGIPEEFAPRLNGETPEALAADADGLRDQLADAGLVEPRPRVSFDGGVHEPERVPPSMNDTIRARADRLRITRHDRREDGRTTL